MTDTLFMIGWYTSGRTISIWKRLERSYRLTPKEITDWLVDEEVSHSYGVVTSERRHPVGPALSNKTDNIKMKVLIIHDPVAACAFRIRWDAMPITVETFSNSTGPVRDSQMVKSMRLLP